MTITTQDRRVVDHIALHRGVTGWVIREHYDLDYGKISRDHGASDLDEALAKARDLLSWHPATNPEQADDLPQATVSLSDHHLRFTSTRDGRCDKFG